MKKRSRNKYTIPVWAFAAVFWVALSMMVLAVYNNSGNGTIVEGSLIYKWTATQNNENGSEENASGSVSVGNTTTDGLYTCFDVILNATSSTYKAANGCDAEKVASSVTTIFTMTNTDSRSMKVTKTVDGKSEDKVLTSNESTELTLTANPSRTDATTSTSVSKKYQFEVCWLDNVTLSADSVDGISYSITLPDGESLNSGGSCNIASGTQITVPSIDTPAGFASFYGWRLSSGGLFQAGATITVSADTTICPIFLTEAQAGAEKVFQVGNETFWFFEDAMIAAVNGTTKTIVLLSNYTMPANPKDAALTGIGGKYAKYVDGTLTYTIPSGVTLLVPFDGTNTICGSNPESCANYADKGTLTAYRTLTIPQNTNITVKGSIEVGGQLYVPQGGQLSYITGSVGLIKMAKNSSIVVDGGSLYAWGFVARNGNDDEGSISVINNGTVYEYLQLGFRGGSGSTGYGMKNNRIFPVSQYFVQNIEVPLTIEAGSKEVLYTGVYASSSTLRTTVDFVSSANAMFNLTSGTFSKDYDEKSDCLILEVDGAATLDKLSLSMGSYSFDSSEYDLPINHCITLNLLSGSTLNVANPVALLPGVKIDIAANAIVNINSSVYVYDRDNWCNNSSGTDVNYAFEGKQMLAVINTAPGIGRITKRTAASLSDVEIDINGAMNVAGNGAIYTTNGGAAIISSEGTGVFNQSVIPGEQKNTYQTSKQNTSKIGSLSASDNGVYDAIPITAAKLKNADNTYTETAEAAAGDVFRYVNGKWINAKVLTLYANDGSGQSTTQYVEKGVATALPVCSFTRSGYRFSWWATAADGSGTTYADGASVTATADLALYAQWIQITYSLNISWVQGSTAVYTETTTYAWNTEELCYTPTTTGSWNSTVSTLTVTLDNSGSTGAVNASFGWTPSVDSNVTWSGGTTMTLDAGQQTKNTLTVTPTAAPPSGKQNGDSFPLGTVTITLETA